MGDYSTSDDDYCYQDYDDYNDDDEGYDNDDDGDFVDGFQIESEITVPHADGPSSKVRVFLKKKFEFFFFGNDAFGVLSSWFS